MLGDIIYVSRNDWDFGFQEYKDNNGMYRHYGLDIGNDKVIHFLNYNDNGQLISKVIISSRREFELRGVLDKCYRTSYKFSKVEIVKRALSCLNLNFNGYNAYENNCEHFVRWCITGERYYNDIDTYLRLKRNLSKYKNYI